MSENTFKICYNPNPYPVKGQHVLSECADRNVAIETAIADSRLWGQAGPQDYLSQQRIEGMNRAVT